LTRSKICFCGRMIRVDEPHECEETSRRKAADNARRYAKRVQSGRYRAGWTHLSRACIARGGCCQECGREDDLTCHLDPGFAGDHREATLNDVITLCRECHGRIDGRRAHARHAGGRR
jgi:5-methylcytosine-specific restriction endonuclease McrA